MSEQVKIAIMQILPGEVSNHFHYIPFDVDGIAYLCGAPVGHVDDLRSTGEFIKWPSTVKGAKLHLPPNAVLIANYTDLDR